MVIETIAVNALFALGKRLGGRALDDFAEFLEGKAKEAVHSLATSFDAPDGEHATQAAVAELERQVRADPQLADALAKPPPPDQLRRATRIEQLAEFLAYEFDLIAGLRRPVALPGFLNCSDCVAVVDVRTRDHWSVSPPEPYGGLGDDPADRVLYFSPEEWKSGAPRVWLIRTASDDRRDALFRQLNDAFWPEPPSPIQLTTFHLNSNEIAHRVLADGEHAQRLNLIGRDRVDVLDQDSGAGPRWYAITAPEGIVLFRDALAALVREQQQRDGIISTELQRRGDPAS